MTLPANSEHEALPNAAAPRLQAVPSGQCFVGLPVRAAAGEALWLQRAFGQLLPRHGGLLVLIEGQVGKYAEDAMRPSGEAPQIPARLGDRLGLQILARWQEVDAARKHLPRSDQDRVQLATWSHYADDAFAALRRELLTAFGMDGEFRADILRRWVGQQRAEPSHLLTAGAARLACLHEIESLAMRLRVGELGGCPVEYGAAPESLVASRLYAGCYAADGLTIERLVGHPPRRVYRRLD